VSETYATMPSPVGELLLTADDGRLTGVYLPGQRRPGSPATDTPGGYGNPGSDPGIPGQALFSRNPFSHAAPEGARRDDAGLAAARAQLEEYFAGARTSFDLPLAPAGTPFRQVVWEELQRIGYGETTTYAALAARIGRPSAVRATGAANGANPISIIIPCHRVIGSNGSLTGYGGGIDAKRFLLDLEQSRA
jgi:methylated-DNA-[protein]-cysteine S-methyltransferase